MNAVANRSQLDCLRLYLITDRSLVPEGNFLAALRQALEGGVRSVQLREKDLCRVDLLALARETAQVTRQFGAKLFINHHADVAEAVGADGVHLTESSAPVDQVKRKYPQLLAGVSAHSLESATLAEAGGADFVTFSPIFDTPSKREYGKPQGLDKLESVAASLRIPVLALGGIKLDNASAVIGRGAFGIALISGIWQSRDIRETSRQFIKLLPGEIS